MANQQQIEIRREQRAEGDGVVIAISRDVMEFCLSHVGLLHVDTGGPGLVAREEGGERRELAWAEITTKMPPPD